MDVLIACHCPTPIHRELSVKNSTGKEFPLRYENYEELGIRSLHYIDTVKCPFSDNPEVYKRWEDIPSGSQDIVFPMFCPIYQKEVISRPYEPNNREGRLIYEMYRVCKKGGSLYIITPSDDKTPIMIEYLKSFIEYKNLNNKTNKFVLKYRVWAEDETMPFSVGITFTDEFPTCIQIVKTVEKIGGLRKRTRKNKGKQRRTRKH